MGKVTIREVAKAAGVSISTVSRVASNAPNVAPEIRRRVQNTIDRLGYTPNIMGQKLSTHALQNVAVVIGRTMDQAFSGSGFIRMIEGISTKLTDLSYNAVLCTDSDPEKEKAHCLQLFRSGFVQGAVILGAYQEDALLTCLSDLKYPFVVIGFPSMHQSMDNRNYNTVETDDYKDCFSAANYLMEHGHRRIGLLHSSLQYRVNQMRAQGFLDALKQQGLEPVAQQEASYEKESIEHAAAVLLSARPQAIFCTDDHKATVVLHTAQQQGLRVPEDISIMGHNDYDICTLVTPSLTTVHVPLTHLGKDAANLVVELIQHPTSTCRNIILPSRIITRDSVATLPDFSSKAASK